MTDFRKTKIHIKSEEHSKAFQEAVFEAGGEWRQSGRFYQKGVNYIFVNKHLSMTLAYNAVFFEDHDYKEIQFPLTESSPVNNTTFETAKIGDMAQYNVVRKLFKTEADLESNTPSRVIDLGFVAMTLDEAYTVRSKMVGKVYKGFNVSINAVISQKEFDVLFNLA